MKLYTLIILIIFGIQGLCFGVLRNRRFLASEEMLSIVRDPQKYDKKLMPYNNDTGPLLVKISMRVLSLEIDDINMRMNTHVYFRLIWNDPRLAYKSQVDSITFSDTSDFWIPDAFFRNSFKTERMYSVHPETMIKINKNGDVRYSSKFHLNLDCPMIFNTFPHDQQTCPLIIESYGYSRKDMDFAFSGESPITVSTDMMISERLMLTDFRQDVSTSGNYSGISLFFTVDRIFNTYLLEWYLPSVSLVILAFMSELLDPASILPRLLITVGPLFTLGIASLIYHQTLPSVSYVTAMDIFSGVSLLVIFITVLHTLISFYYSSQQTPLESKQVEEGQHSKLRDVYKNMKKRANNLVRLLIIGSYVFFLIVYMIAYSI